MLSAEIMMANSVADENAIGNDRNIANCVQVVITVACDRWFTCLISLARKSILADDEVLQQGIL